MSYTASSRSSNSPRCRIVGFSLRFLRWLQLNWRLLFVAVLVAYTLWEILARLTQRPGQWWPLVGWLVFGLSLLSAAAVWYLTRPPVKIILPEDDAKLTFADYWGQPAVVRRARQWVACLSDRRQFAEMGGQSYGGLVLYGLPGAGRTRLARAIAGEANVPFIALTGVDFRVRLRRTDGQCIARFCELARRLAQVYGACVACLDDLETVSCNPSAVARLGLELDNQAAASALKDHWPACRAIYRRPWSVLYVGAATQAGSVSPSLLRPGRFDQRIEIPTPDRVGRREIIQRYLECVQHDATVNIEAIVEDTPHATPAMLAATITRKAVRVALARGRKQIGQQDIDAALQEVLGLERPFEEWEPQQRRQVAYHEAGHAVAQHYLLPDQRIVRVTIIPRTGGLLGHVHYVERVERHSEPLHRFAAKIMVSMAGHAAVKLHTGEYWDGAWGDFRNIRRNIWILYSLGYFGPPVRDFENCGTNVPESAAPLIERFWKTLEDQVENLLRQHAAEVETVAQALLEKEELSQDEVLALLGNNHLPLEAAAIPPVSPSPPAPLSPAPPPPVRMLPPPPPAGRSPIQDTDLETPTALPSAAARRTRRKLRPSQKTVARRFQRRKSGT